MNRKLKNLFNNGKNKGDMVIKSNTNDEIRCHSLIMEQMSGYFNAENHFVLSKDLNEHASKKFDLNYSIDSICFIINVLYDSNYLNNFDREFSDREFSLDEMYEIILLMDFLIILDNEIIKNIPKVLFTGIITIDNWMDIIKSLNNNSALYAHIHELVGTFFSEVILKNLEYLKYDPLENMDICSPMAKYLCQKYRVCIFDILTKFPMKKPTRPGRADKIKVAPRKASPIKVAKRATPVKALRVVYEDDVISPEISEEE